LFFWDKTKILTKFVLPRLKYHMINTNSPLITDRISQRFSLRLLNNPALIPLTIFILNILLKTWYLGTRDLTSCHT